MMNIPKSEITYVIKVSDIPLKRIADAKRAIGAYLECHLHMSAVRRSYRRQFVSHSSSPYSNGDLPYERLIEQALIIDILTELDGVDSIHIPLGHWQQLKNIDVEKLAIEFEELRDFLVSMIPEHELYL